MCRRSSSGMVEKGDGLVGSKGSMVRICMDANDCARAVMGSVWLS